MLKRCVLGILELAMAAAGVNFPLFIALFLANGSKTTLLLILLSFPLNILSSQLNDEIYSESNARADSYSDDDLYITIQPEHILNFFIRKASPRFSNTIPKSKSAFSHNVLIGLTVILAFLESLLLLLEVTNQLSSIYHFAFSSPSDYYFVALRYSTFLLLAVAAYYSSFNPFRFKKIFFLVFTVGVALLLFSQFSLLFLVPDSASKLFSIFSDLKDKTPTSAALLLSTASVLWGGATSTRIFNTTPKFTGWTKTGMQICSGFLLVALLLLSSAVDYSLFSKYITAGNVDLGCLRIISFIKELKSNTHWKVDVLLILMRLGHAAISYASLLSPGCTLVNEVGRIQYSNITLALGIAASSLFFMSLAEINKITTWNILVTRNILAAVSTIVGVPLLHYVFSTQKSTPSIRIHSFFLIVITILCGSLAWKERTPKELVQVNLNQTVH